jgi:hypothetical protein
MSSKTINLCSSPNVRDKVSHTNRTTVRIIMLCILIFTQQKRSQKALNLMVVSITRITFLNLHLKHILVGSLVTTAWRFLGLWMEEQPPAMEVSCEYIE